VLTLQCWESRLTGTNTTNWSVLQRILQKILYRAVLRIRIRIRIRIIYQDPDPFPGCIGSGSVSYSNGTKKLTGRENLTKNTFCVGPVGPTDKENQVKMCEKYRLRNIISLKRQRSGSVSNSRIRIRIKVKSRLRIRINRVWIRNTGIEPKKYRACPHLKPYIPLPPPPLSSKMSHLMKCQ
jgi:hypothetical protein